MLDIFRGLMVDTCAVGQWFGIYWGGQDDHGPLTKTQCWASFSAPCRNNRPPGRDVREMYTGYTVAFNLQWWSYCTTQGSRTFIDISSLFILCALVNQGCTLCDHILFSAYFLVSILTECTSILLCTGMPNVRIYEVEAIGMLGVVDF
jgi:hypothetical protein